MNTNYSVNILENEMQEFKIVRPSIYVCSILVFAIAIVQFINAILNQAKIGNILFQLWPIAVSIAMYLQVRGIGIYKKYFTINDKGIFWKRDFLSNWESKRGFLSNRGKLTWNEIQSIQMNVGEISFHLKDEVKRFSLTHITTTQTTEIKEILQEYCTAKGIQFFIK